MLGARLDKKADRVFRGVRSMREAAAAVGQRHDAFA